MYRINMREDGLYQVVSQSGIPLEVVYGSYADALAYQRSLQRNLAQLQDSEYYDFGLEERR